MRNGTFLVNGSNFAWRVAGGCIVVQRAVGRWLASLRSEPFCVTVGAGLGMEMLQRSMYEYEYVRACSEMPPGRYEIVACSKGLCIMLAVGRERKYNVEPKNWKAPWHVLEDIHPMVGSYQLMAGLHIEPHLKPQ